MEGVRAYIDSGHDVNRIEDNTTPLIVASTMRRHDVVKILLAAGADINLAVDSESPLRAAYLATQFNWNRWAGFPERPAGRYAASLCII